MAKLVKLTDLILKADEAIDAGVGNANQLDAALPLLIALQERRESVKRSLGKLKARIELLGGKCSDYVDKHEGSVFKDTLLTTAMNVTSGSRQVDGIVYHYSSGYDGYERSSPEQTLTQPFLQTLPEGWTKPQLKLDVTAVNNAAPDEKTLLKHGLIRKVKRVWTRIFSQTDEDDE